MIYRLVRRLALISALMTTFGAAYGQRETLPNSERPTSVYKLDYVFSEIQDGKRINVRNYSTLVRVGDRGSIRLGDKVPIVVGNSRESGQTQYMEIGVNIDGRVEQELAAGVGLYSNIQISSLAPEQPGENRTGNPVVRQMVFQLDQIVPVGKQTLIGTADEVDGTRRIQIEATATKVR